MKEVIEDTAQNFAGIIGENMSVKIEQEMAVYIHPRKWYIPGWLYRKIIKDHVSLSFGKLTLK